MSLVRFDYLTFQPPGNFRRQVTSNIQERIHFVKKVNIRSFFYKKKTTNNNLTFDTRILQRSQ